MSTSTNSAANRMRTVGVSDDANIGFSSTRTTRAATAEKHVHLGTTPSAPPQVDTGDESESEDACFICGLGGEVLVCDEKGCGKVYHGVCIGHEPAPEAKFSCPRHFCCLCGLADRRISAMSDQDLMCCSLCPTSFCSAHRPDSKCFGKLAALVKPAAIPPSLFADVFRPPSDVRREEEEKERNGEGKAAVAEAVASPADVAGGVVMPPAKRARVDGGGGENNGGIVATSREEASSPTDFNAPIGNLLHPAEAAPSPLPPALEAAPTSSSNLTAAGVGGVVSGMKRKRFANVLKLGVGGGTETGSDNDMPAVVASPASASLATATGTGTGVGRSGVAVRKGRSAAAAASSSNATDGPLAGVEVAPRPSGGRGGGPTSTTSLPATGIMMISNFRCPNCTNPTAHQIFARLLERVVITVVTSKQPHAARTLLPPVSNPESIPVYIAAGHTHASLHITAGAAVEACRTALPVTATSTTTTTASTTTTNGESGATGNGVGASKDTSHTAEGGESGDAGALIWPLASSSADATATTGTSVGSGGVGSAVKSRVSSQRKAVAVAAAHSTPSQLSAALLSCQELPLLPTMPACVGDVLAAIRACKYSSLNQFKNDLRKAAHVAAAVCGSRASLSSYLNDPDLVFPDELAAAMGASVGGARGGNGSSSGSVDSPLAGQRVSFGVATATSSVSSEGGGWDASDVLTGYEKPYGPYIVGMASLVKQIERTMHSERFRDYLKSAEERIGTAASIAVSSLPILQLEREKLGLPYVSDGWASAVAGEGKEANMTNGSVSGGAGWLGSLLDEHLQLRDADAISRLHAIRLSCLRPEMSWSWKPYAFPMPTLVEAVEALVDFPVSRKPGASMVLDASVQRAIGDRRKPILTGFGPTSSRWNLADVTALPESTFRPFGSVDDASSAAACSESEGEEDTIPLEDMAVSIRDKLASAGVSTAPHDFDHTFARFALKHLLVRPRNPNPGAPMPTTRKGPGGREFPIPVGDMDVYDDSFHNVMRGAQTWSRATLDAARAAHAAQAGGGAAPTPPPAPRHATAAGHGQGSASSGVNASGSLMGLSAGAGAGVAVSASHSQHNSTHTGAQTLVFPGPGMPFGVAAVPLYAPPPASTQSIEKLVKAQKALAQLMGTGTGTGVVVLPSAAGEATTATSGSSGSSCGGEGDGEGVKGAAATATATHTVAGEGAVADAPVSGPSGDDDGLGAAIERFVHSMGESGAGGGEMEGGSVQQQQNLIMMQALVSQQLNQRAMESQLSSLSATLAGLAGLVTQQSALIQSLQTHGVPTSAGSRNNGSRATRDSLVSPSSRADAIPTGVVGSYSALAGEAPPRAASIRSTFLSLQPRERAVIGTLCELAPMDVDGNVDTLAAFLPPSEAEVTGLLSDMSDALRRALITQAELRSAWIASRRAMMSIPAPVGVEHKLLVPSHSHNGGSGEEGAGGDESLWVVGSASDDEDHTARVITLGEGRMALELTVANQALKQRCLMLEQQLAASQLGHALRPEGGAVQAASGDHFESDGMNADNSA